MWDEQIKLRQNSFQFVRNLGELFYKVIDGDGEHPIVENVVRWFNNGFFLTKDEYYIEWESRDGVDLSYTEFTFKIFDNNLEKIFTETSKNSKQFNYLSDFIGNYLIIKGGVIDKIGDQILPFKFTQTEAKHRLLLKVPVENSSTENKCLNLANSLTYKARKSSFQNVDYTQDFISFLKKKVTKLNEVIFHLLLRRYSFLMKESFDEKKKDDLIPYDDKDFILSKYDLTYLIIAIQRRLPLDEPLTINYWDKYNSHYSFKEIETDLQTYFVLSDLDVLQDRKYQLDKILEQFDFKQFSFDTFKRICKDKEKIFETASPYVRGRKVYIQEYRTFESDLTKKVTSLPRKPCTYISPAEFLKEDLVNFHLVQENNDAATFYIVDSTSINVDLILYNYNDYLELLDLNM